MELTEGTEGLRSATPATAPATSRANGRMWTPGQSGNAAGRPIGARGRFSQQFIADLRNAWEQYGADAVAQTALSQRGHV